MKKPIFLTSMLFLLVTTAKPQERVFPNDPLYRFQYSYINPGGKLSIPMASCQSSSRSYDATAGIDPEITRAWAITTGSKKTIIAILDDGFFYRHEDCKDNIWKNPGETGFDKSGFPKETNGIDDDGNGYVDDVMGWDFAFDDPDPDPYVFDGMDNSRIQPYWHGTYVMGIIGAKGNNGLGIAGINWDISMMLLKIGAQGVHGPDRSRAGRAAKAIHYAADNGARIINWSGYIDDLRPESVATLHEAIGYAEEKGILIIVGAGNNGRNIDLPDNITYPACYENENVLTVAEIDFQGNLYRYQIDNGVRGSNYGRKTVDIAALAMNYTTDLKYDWSTYCLGGGTSCSTPVVSGAAALVLSLNPELKAPALKKILLESVTQLPSLQGKIRSGGMINAFRALTLAVASKVTPPGKHRVLPAEVANPIPASR